MNPNALLVVFSTAPDIETAKTLGRLAVSQKCAACVQILPGATSVYEWNGKIEEESECLLILKTNFEHLDELKLLILQNHPYEVPEFVAIEAEQVSDGYSAWLNDALNTKSVES
ncbi:MAG: divalent-cation tolerance protein CutA [Pyrinomonadaceae bacterium]